MVDSINNNSLQHLGGVSPLHQQGEVDSVDVKATAAAQETTSDLGITDRAEVTPGLLDKALKAQELAKFGRAANRLEEPFNAEKVGHFKELMNSGRIHEYLSSLNTEALVDSLVSGPAGGYVLGLSAKN